MLLDFRVFYNSDIRLKPHFYKRNNNLYKDYFNNKHYESYFLYNASIIYYQALSLFLYKIYLCGITTERKVKKYNWP